MEELNWQRWGEPSYYGTVNKIPLVDGVYVYKTANNLELPIKLTNFNLFESSNKLLVVLNAAVAQKNTHPPYFSGSKLASGFNGPVLSISDPGTHFSDVNLAWYAGTKAHPCLQSKICEIIDTICVRASLKPLILGSSGGGFATLALAKLLTIESDCIVINPQTNIFRYWESHVRKYLKECHDLDYSKASEKLLNQKGIVTNVTLGEKIDTPVLYLQNMFDYHHLNHHFGPYFGNENVNNRVSGEVLSTRWFIAPWGRGHHRVWTNQIQLILNHYLAGSSFSEIIILLESIFYPIIKNSSQIHPLGIENDVAGDIDFRSMRFDESFDDTKFSWSIFSQYTKTGKVKKNFYRVLYFLLDYELWRGNQNENVNSYLSDEERELRIKLVNAVIVICEEIGIFDAELSILDALKGNLD